MEWRPWARRLADGWRIIALTAAVAVAVAMLLTATDPHRYRAEAYLAVAKPETELRFDERFAAPETNPAFPYRVNTLRTYGELARTPALAETVAGRLATATGQSFTPEQLLRQVEVQALADGTLIVIQARSDTAAGAARLANAWAEAFSHQMTDVFGAAAADHPIEQAQTEAADALAEAEDALADFHASSLLPALEAEVANLRARQGRLLEAADRLTSVVRDLAALRARALSGDADLADRLTALTLQLNALTSGSDAPVDLDLTAGGLDVRVGADDLDALGALVAESRGALDAAISDAPSELAERTSELERERALLARLQRTKILAEERFMTLSRKADEMDVARETSRPELRIAAAATVPTDPDLSPFVRNALIALVLGAMAGAVLVLVLGARAKSRSEPVADTE